MRIVLRHSRIEPNRANSILLSRLTFGTLFSLEFKRLLLLNTLTRTMLMLLLLLLLPKFCVYLEHATVGLSINMMHCITLVNGRVLKSGGNWLFFGG
jgi:hypothetical protein